MKYFFPSFLSILLSGIVLNNAYSRDNLYNWNQNYGGAVNNSFGSVSGPRDGSGQISGHGWLVTSKELNKDYHIKNTIGISLEKIEDNIIIFNDLSTGFYTPKSEFIIGRTLNASGRLHHDLYDFGTPGINNDNAPISYFYNGNFSTNVGQKIVKPFTPRLSYYYKPYKEYLAFGISLAPTIDDRHEAGYRFFADTAVKNELSTSYRLETTYKNYFIGISQGYTQADRKYSRFYPKNKIYAHQASIMFINTKNNQSKTIYEINYGSLHDRDITDIRTGVQRSTIRGRSIYSASTQQREIGDSQYIDYGFGYQYLLSDDIRIGFEETLRHKINKNADYKNLSISAGIQYQF